MLASLKERAGSSSGRCSPEASSSCCTSSRASCRARSCPWVPLFSAGLGLWRRVAEGRSHRTRPVLVLGAGRTHGGSRRWRRGSYYRPHAPRVARGHRVAGVRRSARTCSLRHVRKTAARSLCFLSAASSTRLDLCNCRCRGRRRVARRDAQPRRPASCAATRGASAFAFALRRARPRPRTALTLLALPVLLVATAAVASQSRAPPGSGSRRVGRGGKIFTLWKVRTMRQDAEAGTGPDTRNAPKRRARDADRLSAPFPPRRAPSAPPFWCPMSLIGRVRRLRSKRKCPAYG